MSSGIYIATYSAVDVFESTFKTVPLMRRCDDNWVNATQILKIAGYGKAQRTRLLEREVHQHIHRKVQGGFGRFQGTWVPLDVGRRLAETHNVAKTQVPVLYYDPATDGPVAKKITSKSRPRARSKAKAKSQGDGAGSPKQGIQFDGQDGSGNAKLLAESSKVRKPKKRGRKSKKEKELLLQQEILQQQQQQQQAMPPTFAMYGNSVPAESAAAPAPPPPALSAPDVIRQQQQQQPVSYPAATYGPGPHAVPSVPPPPYTRYAQPQLRGQHSRNGSATLQAYTEDMFYAARGVQSPRSPASDKRDNSLELEQQQQQQQMSGEADYDYYTETLLNFFSIDGEPVPDFLFSPPYDFDINRPIDNEGHTPLHWASALALPAIVRLLISKGANPLILNVAGMNSLSKLIHFTNSFDLKNFPDILQLLRQCLIVPDARGRTPIHYLIELSVEQGKFDCLKYYYDGIVRFIQKQQLEAERLIGTEGPHKDLLKILLDHRDNDGDTALHVAIKTGSREFAKLLIHYGADVSLVGIDQVPNDLLKELGMLRSAVVSEKQALISAQEPYTTTISETTVTKDPSTLMLGESMSKSPEASVSATATGGVLDAAENKENIYADSLVSKAVVTASMGRDGEARRVELSVPATKPSDGDLFTSTPAKPLPALSMAVSTTAPLQDDSLQQLTPQTVQLLEAKFPQLLGSLTESMRDEFNGKSEEACHNAKTIKNLDKEIGSINRKCIGLLRDALGEPDETRLAALVEEPASTGTVSRLMDERIADNKRVIASKYGQLFNAYERSQALEVAKFVHEEEDKMEEFGRVEENPAGSFDPSSDDSIRLLIELTVLQIERRRLVNGKVESVVGGSGAQLPGLEPAKLDEEKKVQVKMYLYKKLISNICSLPMEDINKNLLDGIEMRLNENQISA